MTLDEQIDLLFKELSSKKEELKELKRRISSKWKTNGEVDRKSTRLNSSHSAKSRMPSSA